MKKLIAILLVTCACLQMHAQVTIIQTIAGRDTAGFNGDNIPATDAELNFPEFIFLDKNENIFISDGFNQRVRKINASTGKITTVAGSGNPGFNGEGIPATSAAMRVPEAIFVDSVGNIFIADALNYIIREVDAMTGLISTVAGNTIPGSSGDGGPATNAKLSAVAGLYLDKSGNIYIGDYNNDKVRRVDAGTGIITTFAGTGSTGYSGDNGAATNAQLHGPIQIYADSVGNVYICDQWNHAIRKVDIATGIIVTIAGNGTAGHAGDNGAATAAELNQPCGIDMDAQGNIFIADYGDGTIRRIDGATGIITTVAGNDTLGFAGDGGPATNAELRCGDVHVDRVGTIYIADEDNNRVRKVYNPKLAAPSEAPEGGIIKLFPNPAGEELYICYIFTNEQAGVFQLFDVAGRTIMSCTLASDKQSEVLNIRDLTRGVYIFNITQQNKTLSSGELIKE